MTSGGAFDMKDVCSMCAFCLTAESGIWKEQCLGIGREALYKQFVVLHRILMTFSQFLL